MTPAPEAALHRLDVVAASIADAERLEAMTGRSCGRCTLWCDIVGVGELKKQPDTKCKHCTPGKGCAVYAHWPDTCRGWSCLWLISKSFSDAWFPAKARIVAYMTTDAYGSNLALMFEVDRAPPRTLARETLLRGSVADGIFGRRQRLPVKTIDGSGG